MGGRHTFAITSEIALTFPSLQARNRPGHLRGDREGERKIWLWDKR